MNREEAKKLLPIIQAYADGKTVQVSTPSGAWNEVINPRFDLRRSEYRIKPEPREVYIIKPEGCIGGESVAYSWAEAEAISRAYRSNRKAHEVLKLREVI